ncbi:hypothetical protein JOM56_014430 [Amanita muscaria]
MSSLHEVTDRSSSSFIGPITTAPEAKMEDKHGEVYSLYHCDAEDHLVSCHCDAPSTSPSPALASEQSHMPTPTFISEQVETACGGDPVSPQMTAPERQSGLSCSESKNQEFVQAPDRLRARLLSDVPTVPIRPPSRQKDRPHDDSQPPASLTSSPEPAARLSSPPEPSAIRNYVIRPRYINPCPPSRFITEPLQVTPAGPGVGGIHNPQEFTEPKRLLHDIPVHLQTYIPFSSICDTFAVFMSGLCIMYVMHYHIISGPVSKVFLVMDPTSLFCM